LNLTNEKVGHLTVLYRAESRTNARGKKLTRWWVECACGSEPFVVDTADLTSKEPTQSCGCGLAKNVEYLEVGLYKSIALRRYQWLTPVGYCTRSFIRAKLGEPTTRPFWLCRCKGRDHKDPTIANGCKRWVRVSSADIRKGKVYSCTVCAKACKLERWKLEKAEIEDERVNGLSERKRRTLTRRSYDAMLYRYRHDPAYHARGIHLGWVGQGGFKQFIKDVGLRPKRELTLHRLKPEFGYFPGKCEWADRPTQDRVRTDSRLIEVDGQHTNLCDLATLLGKPVWYVSRRIERLTSSGLTERMAVDLILADQQSVQNNVNATSTERIRRMNMEQSPLQAFALIE
jgi:hypothetical protein